MAKETKPITYRVSPKVNMELRRLAKVHGGVDRALRVLLFGATETRRPLREKGDEKR